jgi:transcription elongation factor Elf1
VTAPEPAEDVPSANAPAIAALVCTAPTCGHRNQHVQIHADTVLPVHCGGCGAVLHCDHRPETTKVRAGTIGAPLEHTITACTVCGTELARDTAALPPIDLATLPVGVLDLPL